MMRLTETTRNRQLVSLTVEGWVTGDRSTLLETECAKILATGRAVRLDLSMVTFVDGRGSAVIRRLLARHVTIVRCPPFILEFVNHKRHSQ